MAETFNIQIQADKSGAEDALNEVKKSLDAGKEAAEAFSHVLDGDVSGAFKSLGELAKTLGVSFDLAFSPAEIISFVKAAAEVGEKLSTLIADTYIYTDAARQFGARPASPPSLISGAALQTAQAVMRGSNRSALVTCSSARGRPRGRRFWGKGFSASWHSRQKKRVEVEPRRRSSEVSGALHSSQRGGPTRPLGSCPMDTPLRLDADRRTQRDRV